MKERYINSLERLQEKNRTLKDKNETLEEKNESLKEKNESLEDKNTNSCPAVFKENNILKWKSQERQSIPWDVPQDIPWN